jgi:hypothetical protein
MVGVEKGHVSVRQVAVEDHGGSAALVGVLSLSSSCSYKSMRTGGDGGHDPRPVKAARVLPRWHQRVDSIIRQLGSRQSVLAPVKKCRRQGRLYCVAVPQ